MFSKAWAPACRSCRVPPARRRADRRFSQRRRHALDQLDAHLCAKDKRPALKRGQRRQVAGALRSRGTKGWDRTALGASRRRDTVAGGRLRQNDGTCDCILHVTPTPFEHKRMGSKAFTKQRTLAPAQNINVALVWPQAHLLHLCNRFRMFGSCSVSSRRVPNSSRRCFSCILTKGPKCSIVPR
jgi:hypothetical protein